MDILKIRQRAAQAKSEKAAQTVQHVEDVQANRSLNPQVAESEKEEAERESEIGASDGSLPVINTPVLDTHRVAANPSTPVDFRAPAAESDKFNSILESSSNPTAQNQEAFQQAVVKENSKRSDFNASETSIEQTLPEQPSQGERGGSGAFVSAFENDPLIDFLARYEQDEGTLTSSSSSSLYSDANVERRCLSFELEGESYAAPIMDVREILRVISLTPVPRAPSHILGVFSKRGLVMPIIDLAAVFRLREPQPEITDKARVLVIGEGDDACGLRVDRLHQAIRFSDDTIESLPSGIDPQVASLFSGLGHTEDRMFILLNVPALLEFFASATPMRQSQ